MSDSLRLGVKARLDFVYLEPTAGRLWNAGT